MEKKNFLPGWLYDLLKWICIIVAPAAVTLLKVVADAWHWDIPVDAICTTITAVAAFIGAIIGISSLQYKKDNADAQSIVNLINSLKNVLNSSETSDKLEGSETSTETIEERVELVEAPDNEEGKG